MNAKETKELMEHKNNIDKQSKTGSGCEVERDTEEMNIYSIKQLIKPYVVKR